MSEPAENRCRKQRGTEHMAVLAPAISVACVAFLGYLAGGYIQYIVFLCLIAVVCAVSLVLVVGLARMITLATGAIMGLGAYTLSILLIHFDPALPVGLIASGLVGGIAGGVLGMLTVRFRGHYLAMVTLVFQSVVIIVIRQWPELTGGTQGMWVPKGSILGLTIETDTHNLLIGAILAAVAVVSLSILIRGHFGRILRAIAATEVGSEAFGINISAFRVVAFTVSSVIIALAGAVHAMQVRILDPEAYGIMTSVLMLAYPIVGGMTSVWGGIVGGGILQALPEMLRTVSEYKEFAYAALVIVVMIFLPGGLIELPGQILAKFRRVRGTEDTSFNRPNSHANTDGGVEPDLLDAVSLPSRSTTPALEVIGLSKNFGALAAVNNVSLSVPQGRIHGIIGPNGAGKTTLFNLISGFLEAEIGDVSLLGNKLNGKPARVRIAFGATRTFQNVAVFGKLTCLDNVIIGLGENGVAASICRSVEDVLSTRSSRERVASAMRALAVVGLEGYANTPAGTLSLGEQRCLEIARAIVSKPKILLLDEPVSGLETAERERLHELLIRINASLGVTMLIVEHNIPFVVDLCDHLSIMHNGAILAEGIPEQVIARQEVRQVYFGESVKAS